MSQFNIHSTNTTPTKGNDAILVGVITGAHGIGGLVKVKPFTENPQDLANYDLFDANNTVYTITIKGKNKGNLLVSLSGCTDRNTAESLRGIELFINRKDMPELDDRDEFYHADLIGLTVKNHTDNSTYGTIRAIYDFGSGDILDIVRPDGSSEMHRFSTDICPVVDVSEGYITLSPMDTSDDALTQPQNPSTQGDTVS